MVLSLADGRVLSESMKIGLVVAGWCMLVLTSVAWAGDTTYRGLGPKVPSGQVRSRYTLILEENGQATLRTEKSKRNRLYEGAKWLRLDTGKISLQFIDRSGEPRGEPTVWQEQGSQLTPVSWGKAEWQDEAPPKLSRK